MAHMLLRIVAFVCLLALASCTSIKKKTTSQKDVSPPFGGPAARVPAGLARRYAATFSATTAVEPPPLQASGDAAWLSWCARWFFSGL